MGSLSTVATVVRSTLAAAAGQSGSLFPAAGRLHHGLVRFNDGVQFPGGTELMSGGRHHGLLLRIAPLQGGISSVCLKFPNLYGAEQDQDFLLVSSADGAPLHHVALPTSSVGARPYSSLWLYLAGLSPVLFGVKAENPSVRIDGGVDFAEGDEMSFVISPPVGAFRQIGVITVGQEVADSSGVRFAGRNCGGNLRALLPVRLYRDN